MKNYKIEIEQLKKMLKHYGNVVLIRQCDKGIVLITEYQKSLTFVERDGEIYYLVYEIIDLISKEGLTFENAFKKFEEISSCYDLLKQDIEYMKNILDDKDYYIKQTKDEDFPIIIQYVDEEKDIYQTYLNRNSNKYKALKIIVGEEHE